MRDTAHPAHCTLSRYYSCDKILFIAQYKTLTSNDLHSDNLCILSVSVFCTYVLQIL